MNAHIGGSQALRLAVCLALGATAPPAAVAQEVGKLEEIIVTAQKREQKIEDIPMSITALSLDDIAQSGAATIEDLQFKVRGLVSESTRAASSTNCAASLPTRIADRRSVRRRCRSTRTMPIRTLQSTCMTSSGSRCCAVRRARFYGEGSMGGTINT
jgi:hypothetical protein